MHAHESGALDALQQMPLSACPRRGELWVRNVMLWTRGDELTELKTLCDLKGDVPVSTSSCIRTSASRRSGRIFSNMSSGRRPCSRRIGCYVRGKSLLGATEALEKCYLTWTTRCCVPAVIIPLD